jgi:hypothetical protein
MISFDQLLVGNWLNETIKQTHLERININNKKKLGLY